MIVEILSEASFGLTCWGEVKQKLRFPVSSEISDFTPCTHVPSNILHIKYAEKTDDYGLGIRV